jgi:hypothetical protein
MQANDVAHRWRWIWPDQPGHLFCLACIAVGTLCAAFAWPGIVLEELVVRIPDLKCPEWLAYAWILGAFFLSGVTTMLASRRWLPAPSTYLVAVKRVAVLAFAPLLSLLAFVYGGALFMRETAGLGSLYAVGTWGVLWLCWVAGGLAVALRRVPGAGGTDRAATADLPTPSGTGDGRCRAAR